MVSDIKVTRKKLSDYTPDPHNANLGSERGYLILDDSITQDGVGRSGLVDKNGVIIAGNQTMEVLAANGIEDVIEIETTGKEWVIVKRTDTDLADSDPNNMARRMAYRDNRSVDVSLTWSPEQLQADKEAGVEIVEKLWSPVELDILGVGDGEVAEDAGAQIDRAAELQEKWQVERGDVWEVGKHRLMCGDSTCAEDVDKLMDGVLAQLMVTDPPYGVSYADKNKFLNTIDRGNRIQTPMVNDHLTTEETRKLWLDAFTRAYEIASPGCPYYMTGPQGGELMMMMMIERSGWLLKHMLIWVKNNHVLGRADYNYKHEPILYGWKKGGHKFYAVGSAVSVWEVDKPLKSDLHPTTKPVELFIRAIKNSTVAGQSCYDPFLGSGTTLVACEQTNRIGYGMEIAPEYVAVCLERLAGMGLSPVRVESKSPIAGAVGGAE